MSRRWLVVTVGAALTLGLVAAGPASAATARAGILVGAVHSEGSWSYEDGSERSFVADLGILTKKTAGSFNVFRRDQVLVTVAYGPDLCVRKDGLPSSIGAVRVGMRSLAIQEVQDDGSLLAAALRAGRPLVRWDQPGCGLLRRAVHGDSTITYVDGSARDFDWDRGEITEIGDTSVSVVRSDGVTVTVSYDDETVHRGHQGMDDLEPGDRIRIVSEDLGGGALLAKVITYLPQP